MMAHLGEFEVHPFTDAFPSVDGDEFTQLVADVKKNGLRDPIILNHDGTVLIDGRNRYRACNAAGVDPVYVRLGEQYTEPMILNLIVSKNIARRQLNPGQKAVVALDYEEYYAKAVGAAEAARRLASPSNQYTTESSATVAGLPQFPLPFVAPEVPGVTEERKSREHAAKATGASGRAVQQAKAVQRDAPELVAKVRSGEISLDAAERQRKQLLASMPKPEPAPKPSKTMLTLRTHTGEPVDYQQPDSKAAFNDTKGDGISWANWSWNPVTGCLHNCDYCYARASATDPRYASRFPAGFTPLFHHERLDAPANTRIPQRYRDDQHAACGSGDCQICAYRRVFVCSMADLYGRWVPSEWIEQVHASMLLSPQWEYMLLTKFPARYVGLDLPPNAWVGTSIDEQKRVRIAEDAFRKIDDVKVKWLSLEPLKEPLEFDDLSMFDWIVIGAQTATRQPDGPVAAFAPPWEWVCRITMQAKAAGCKVHWKPNLFNGSPGLPMNEYPEA